MPGACAWAGTLHTVSASVVVTAPGVRVELGRDTRPCTAGMTMSGTWTPDRSGPPAACPGTACGAGAVPMGGRWHRQ